MIILVLVLVCDFGLYFGLLGYVVRFWIHDLVCFSVQSPCLVVVEVGVEVEVQMLTGLPTLPLKGQSMALYYLLTGGQG